MKRANTETCHCGAALPYANCCERFVSGRENAGTAEELMRSRYSGFVLQDEDYLRASWHPDTRPSRVRFDSAQRWIGLRIKSTVDGGAADCVGQVEFVARYKLAGRGHRLHERSRFEKIDGRWYYLNGKHL